MGVTTSYTTPYNPQGNGQTERYNGIIWKTIQLALKALNLPTTAWETVITQALHSVRSLLCTATGCTPHERMFTHTRRSSNGQSMPTWLAEGKKALLKNNVRVSKYDPIVEEVELIETNPLHSQVRLQNGRDVVVSNRQLAPVADSTLILEGNADDTVPSGDTSRLTVETNLNLETPNIETTDRSSHSPDQQSSQSSSRPVRERRPPAYLSDYHTL